jgi:anthranilate/para-aminobenzoate synthase component II
VVRAERVMHGKTCSVEHQADELFDGMPSPFTAMRYHSLVVDWAVLPHDLVVTFQMNAASLPHAKLMQAIEALGTRVAPALRNAFAGD